MLYELLADMLGVASANPALPVVHALTLLVLLGAPRDASVARQRLKAVLDVFPLMQEFLDRGSRATPRGDQV